jgi:hypothetical protein
MEPPGTNSNRIFNVFSSLTVPKYLCLQQQQQKKNAQTVFAKKDRSFKLRNNDQNKLLHLQQCLDAKGFSEASLLPPVPVYEPITKTNIGNKTKPSR